MSDYKPLTDEELESAKLGAQQWNQGLLGLIEQARRANALAAAIKKLNTFLETAGNYHGITKLENEADAALAAYLGETND